MRAGSTPELGPVRTRLHRSSVPRRQSDTTPPSAGGSSAECGLRGSGGHGSSRSAALCTNCCNVSCTAATCRALLQRFATALAAARAEIDGVAKGIDHVVLSEAELKMFCTDLHFGEYR
jgi:hypothetical protein